MLTTTRTGSRASRGPQRQEDLAAGLLPFFVAGTIGTTSSGAVDDLTAIGQIGGCCGAAKGPNAPWQASPLTSSALHFWPRAGSAAAVHDLWFHVDAAWAGSACICPEYRPLLKGLEYATSYDFNMHKWLLTNFDCSLLW